VRKHTAESRPRTIKAGKRLRPEEVEAGKALADVVYTRPRTRADCCHEARPCPFVGCRYNLFLDVSETHGIKLNHPDKTPGEVVESCALDCADRGGMTLDEVSRTLNMSRERVRQIEQAALGAFVRLAREAA